MAGDKTIREEINEFLHQKNYFTDALAFIEQKTCINRIYLCAGFVSLFALYLVVGYASDFIVALLGFLYPAYTSVKAIESTNKEDDTQWLTYWVVYSTFTILEFFSDMFLSWFPLYFLFKCAFLVWCMSPFSWNGSALIYQRFIKPFVLKYAKEVDEYLDKGEELAKEYMEKAKKEVTEAVVEGATAGSQDPKKDE